MSRLSRRELWLAGPGSAAFGLAFSYPLFAHFTRIGRVWDWDQFLQLEWVPYWSVAHFHQLPLWNPYLCGGLPMLADPQGRVLSPFFPLHLLFGPAVGIHLEIPFHLAFSFLGGYLLGRRQGLGVPGSVACASGFPASSWFFLHIAVGHLWAFAWLWLPWVALFVLIAVETRALIWAILAGLIAALMFGEGGPYQTSHAVLLAALLCLTLGATRRSASPLVVLAAFATFAVGFAAIKLVPTYRLLQIYPRPTDISLVDYKVRSLYVALFSRKQDLWRPSIGGAAFYEYGAYVNPLAALLAMLGVVTSPKRLAPWIVAALFFIVMAAGEGGFPYAWQWLHAIPPFSSERVTPRFMVPFVFTLSVMAGYGADFLDRRFKRPGRALALVLIAIAIFDAWSVSVSNLGAVVEIDDPPADGPAEFHQFATGRPAVDMYPHTKSSNQGDPTCYGAFPVPTTVTGENEHGYKGEQYLLGTGSVRLDRWTPNRLSYEVDAPAPTAMVVNQNYDAYWQVVKGKGEVFSSDGLLAVRLLPGAQHLELAYRSTAFTFGAVVTLLTCVAAFLLRSAEF